MACVYFRNTGVLLLSNALELLDTIKMLGCYSHPEVPSENLVISLGWGRKKRAGHKAEPGFICMLWLQPASLVLSLYRPSSISKYLEYPFQVLCSLNSAFSSVQKSPMGRASTDMVCSYPARATAHRPFVEFVSFECKV